MSPVDSQQSSRFYYLLLASIVLTVALVLVQAYLPMREVDAIERFAVSSYLFTDQDAQGVSRGRFLPTGERFDDAAERFLSMPFSELPEKRVSSLSTPGVEKLTTRYRCDYSGTEDSAYCGYALAFSSRDGDPTEEYLDTGRAGVDLSHVRYLKLRVNYQGPDDNLRVTIRSYNPKLVNEGISTGINVTNYVLRREKMNRPIVLKVDDFQPVAWFLESENVDFQDAQNNLENVLSIGIELPYRRLPGKHLVELDSLVLGSEWIDRRTLHQALFWLWVFALSFLSLSQILDLRRKAELDQQKIRQLKRSNRKLMTQSEFLRELSQRDTLTGVLNREGFEQFWRQLVPQVQEDQGLAMIVVDLDHFKSINDRFGHQAGDEILKILGGLLMANVRQDDIVCRWGGEEFVVVCEVPDAESGRQRAEYIREKIASRFVNYQLEQGDALDKRQPRPGSRSQQASSLTETLSVTASLGVAFIAAESSRGSGESKHKRLDSSELFNRADQALYAAKDQGRNCVVLAEPL